MIENITILLLLSEISILAYLNSAWGEFVFDDLLIVDKVLKTHVTRKGGSLRDLWFLRKSKRGFLWWTYHRDALEHGILDGSDWHRMNIACHAISVCLVYSILLWWYLPWGAFAGALMIAVHPIGTASVCSISGRSSLMAFMFAMASLLAYLAGAWYLVPILFLLGFKSKEEIIVLPALLFVMWWYR